jgi:DNA-binding NarL/FixJ family response regulator
MTHALAGKRILIAEGEFVVAADIASEVSARGAVVVGPAETVEGAVKAVKNADVDGAILDINLRGKAAFPVADGSGQPRHPDLSSRQGTRSPKYRLPARTSRASKNLPRLTSFASVIEGQESLPNV